LTRIEKKDLKKKVIEGRRILAARSKKRDLGKLRSVKKE
jgi:hypothetical protein